VRLDSGRTFGYLEHELKRIPKKTSSHSLSGAVNMWDITNILQRHFDADILKIEKIIFNGPATILFYVGVDGKSKKAVAKCHSYDKYDWRVGLEVALMKAFHRELPKAILRLTS